MTRHSSILSLALVSITALAVACGDKAEDSGNVSNDGASAESSGGNDEEGVVEETGASVSATGPDSDTGMNPSASGADDSTGDTAGFILPPDGGGVAVECDVWAQDCPPGEKCMPWANDGGSSWNATRCSEVDESPGQVGDECTVDGSGVSGIDSCDLDMMCYYVDPDTNLGQCIEFCQGAEANPLCDPGFVCSIANNGVLTLCRPECDPLLQDCVGSAACLPAAGSQLFTCIIDASGKGGAAGDPCEFINSCDPGLFCAGADAVPGCQQSTGCCSEFCDLTLSDPSAACSLGGGQECVPWYEEGQAPPGNEGIGSCAVPQ